MNKKEQKYALAVKELGSDLQLLTEDFNLLVLSELAKSDRHLYSYKKKFRMDNSDYYLRIEHDTRFPFYPIKTHRRNIKHKKNNNNETNIPIIGASIGLMSAIFFDSCNNLPRYRLLHALNNEHKESLSYTFMQNFVNIFFDNFQTLADVYIPLTLTLKHSEALHLASNLAYEQPDPTRVASDFSSKDSWLAALANTRLGFWGEGRVYELISKIENNAIDRNSLLPSEALLSLLRQNRSNEYHGGCPSSYRYGDKTESSQPSAVTMFGRTFLEIYAHLSQNPNLTHSLINQG